MPCCIASLRLIAVALVQDAGAVLVSLTVEAEGQDDDVGYHDDG